MTVKRIIFEGVNKRKKYIAILLIFLLIISIGGIVITSSILRDGEEGLVAIAGADSTNVRTGEIINFHSDESRGNIKSSIWNFSDGTVSNERNPSHSFLIAGIYNISLMIIGDDERQANTSITVWIQHLDDEVLSTRDRLWDLHPRRWTPIGQDINIGPNAGNPTVSVRIDLDRLVGRVYFRVEYIIDQFSDDEEIHEIYTEIVTLTGGSHVFTYTVQPTDLQEDVSTRENTDLWAFIDLIEGNIEGITFHISTSYPIMISENNVE